jgi:DNA-binding NarL/FixJ family response regulator
MIKVAIADDHPIVRAGLKQILSEDPGIEVAGEAGDGNSLLDQVRRQDFDVVLLDLTMPGPDGLDVPPPLSGLSDNDRHAKRSGADIGMRSSPIPEIRSFS